MNGSQTKHCKQCGETKDVSQFNRRGNKRQPQCRQCANAMCKRHYAANRDSYRARAVRKRREIKELVRGLKNVPCADCKNTFHFSAMDFDHLENKHFNIASDSRWVSRKRLLDEIAKCDVVCANCHRLRTWNRINRE